MFQDSPKKLLETVSRRKTDNEREKNEKTSNDQLLKTSDCATRTRQKQG